MSKKADVIVSIVFVIVGLLTLFESFKIRLLKFGSALGGDFFPKFLSVSLIVLSSIWFFTSLYSYLKEKRVSYNASKLNLVKPVLFIIAFSIYIISLKWFGFTLPTTLLVFVNYVLLKSRFKYADLLFGSIYSILITLTIWFLFSKVLGLMLPRGNIF
ncbi:tripartite tricarboxylate transporter TctB family protein [Pseudothermotoga elfii]|jgi:hypothetical protein